MPPSDGYVAIHIRSSAQPVDHGGTVAARNTVGQTTRKPGQNSQVQGSAFTTAVREKRKVGLL